MMNHMVESQGIVGCTPIPTWAPYGKSLYKPYRVGIYGFFNPQKSLENTINTMGTLLGVHTSLSTISTMGFGAKTCWIKLLHGEN